MKTVILHEAGYDEALLGLALSYNSEPSERVALNLSKKQGGHNKFLESICVWLDMNAPRYFWQQFDTYRVGTTKQSESTMHTLMRRKLEFFDFQGGCHEDILDRLNIWIDRRDFDMVKRHLPESFLQRRIVCTNYKVLQNIYIQRKDHKLKEWSLFLNDLRSQLDHWILIEDE